MGERRLAFSSFDDEFFHAFCRFCGIRDDDVAAIPYRTHQGDKLTVRHKYALVQRVVRDEHDIRVTIGGAEHDVLALSIGVDVTLTDVVRRCFPGLEPETEAPQAVFQLRTFFRSRLSGGVGVLVRYFGDRYDCGMRGPDGLYCSGNTRCLDDAARNQTEDGGDTGESGCRRISPVPASTRPEQHARGKRVGDADKDRFLQIALQGFQLVREPAAFSACRKVCALFHRAVTRGGQQPTAAWKTMHSESRIAVQIVSTCIRQQGITYTDRRPM